VSVCAHRPGDGGSFKPCGPCRCAAELQREGLPLPVPGRVQPGDPKTSGACFPDAPAGALTA
jgi:hypothetical protein